MREECSDPTTERLLRIVLDNAQRVERIVSDVLELGRRDRAHREKIDLRQTLSILVEEYTLKENVAAGVVQLEITGPLRCFSTGLIFIRCCGTLLATRCAIRREWSEVSLLVRDGKREGGVELHVIDDGEGVDESYTEHIFDPFLPRTIAVPAWGSILRRELCDANGARLS